MDSKKRARTEDVDPPSSKKRALSIPHDSPVLNGAAHDNDEPKDEANLEMFRKDAIYRRMKHYSRENEKSLAKIAELERRRDTCEAGLAALEACWTQTLITCYKDVYDLTSRVSGDADTQYVDQLRVKMQATEQLVVAFVKLSKQGGLNVTQDDTFKQCQEAQTECAALRSEVSLLQAKLKNTQSEKENYRERLQAAEKRIDRLQSKTVSAMNLHKEPVQPETKDEPRQDTPSSPTVVQQPNDVPSTDTIDWEHVAKYREGKLKELLAETLTLKQNITTLKVAAKRPPEPLIKETHFYQVLLAHASKLEHTISENKEEIMQLKAQVELLTCTRQVLEKNAQSDQEKAVQELQLWLTKRDNENLRLREQRDQLMAELNERKHREGVKLQSTGELKALLDSRSERIKALETELTRMKMRIAADGQDEELMKFFQHSHDDITYIKYLKGRLEEAEGSIKTYGEAPLQWALRIQLADKRKIIDEYKDIFGDTASPDIRALSDRLKQKTEEIQKLQSRLSGYEQTESMLYAELEKLSAAWEALDRQVKSKVFDLSAMEEKVSKSNLEKAKAENKFYATMREKEAIENERKAAIRAFEKQSQAVEKLLSTEKVLLARVADLEREVSSWKHISEQQNQAALKLEKENHEWQIRANGERKRTDDTVAIVRKHDEELHNKQQELQLMEENLIKSQKEVEKQLAKAKSTAQYQTSGSSSREAELQSEVDKCMVRIFCNI
ncbi:hypothetical protein EIP86_003385 [Pleurotus ostreatoroseus]|nr:hypothetical protein EIP86_003385 [Pleurotus ostreatoroseus]